MVKSEYWKDGWIWLEPPRFEALGEGWYVLASDVAVEAIRRAFPDAQTHLWVERHSHGEKPYEGSWHLRRPFGVQTMRLAERSKASNEQAESGHEADKITGERTGDIH
jgi:hypothetical protein